MQFSIITLTCCTKSVVMKLCTTLSRLPVIFKTIEFDQFNVRVMYEKEVSADQYMDRNLWSGSLGQGTVGTRMQNMETFHISKELLCTGIKFIWLSFRRFIKAIQLLSTLEIM